MHIYYVNISCTVEGSTNDPLHRTTDHNDLADADNLSLHADNGFDPIDVLKSV